MAGIIKAEYWEAAPTSSRHEAFNFEDMADRAGRYLTTVREQAARILTDARREAERVTEQAKQAGRAEALREAEQRLRETLDQQLTTLLPALERAVDDIRHSKATWIQQWERQTVRLATAIAEQVIRREVQRDPEITVDLVREALELAMGAGSVTVHMSPQDFEALRDRVEKVASQLRSVAAANIVPDPEVTAGGCRVVTQFGVIDQTFEAQLRRIAEEIV